MLNMKTTTVREVQHRFSAVLAQVGRGHEITVTRRGKVVARIVPPAAPRKNKKPQWPDFAARMNEIFPDGPPPGKPASQLIVEMRDREL